MDAPVCRHDTSDFATELRLRKRLWLLRGPCMSSESPMPDQILDENQNPARGTKPYEAPKIIRVSLRPDEAVLGHCKTPSSAGPAAPGCGIALGGCMSFGS